MEKQSKMHVEAIKRLNVQDNRGKQRLKELFKTAATSIVVKMNVAKSFHKCCSRNSRTKLAAVF